MFTPSRIAALAAVAALGITASCSGSDSAANEATVAAPTSTVAVVSDAVDATAGTAAAAPADAPGNADQAGSQIQPNQAQTPANEAVPAGAADGAPPDAPTDAPPGPPPGAQDGSGGPGQRGGPGGGVSPQSVTSVDQLNTLVQQAYGDAGLGLQRGHQPVESTLIDVLGISHDEMHVRMEQGQNLAAVAADLGIDPQTLIDALVESWSPAIDNLIASGDITAEQGDQYRAALADAFAFRVTWNGTDATPTFTGI